MNDLKLIWYCAITDEIFLSGYLEGLFYALSLDFDPLCKEFGIDLIGVL